MNDSQRVRVSVSLARPSVVEVGFPGQQGKKGDKGDPLTFDDLTPDQKAELKGEKGDTFTFNDLTPEQKAELKGEKGDPGKDGEDAYFVADVADIENLF